MARLGSLFLYSLLLISACAQTAPLQVLILDPILPSSPCVQKCQAACSSATCVSECQTLQCAAGNSAVGLFFLLVVSCMGAIALANEVFYSREVKEKMKRSSRREPHSHYIRL